MTDISIMMASLDWCLRSGGAEAADESFEKGAIDGRREIYLPWRGFRDNVSQLYRPKRLAFDIAALHHPRWPWLEDAHQKLMARTSHVILGPDLSVRSKFLVCWTKDGAVEKTTGRTGGTGQAIRVARVYQVPVFNLAVPEHLDAWKQVIDEDAA